MGCGTYFFVTEFICSKRDKKYSKFYSLPQINFWQWNRIVWAFSVKWSAFWKVKKEGVGIRQFWDSSQHWDRFPQNPSIVFKIFISDFDLRILKLSLSTLNPILGAWFHFQRGKRICFALHPSPLRFQAKITKEEHRIKDWRTETWKKILYPASRFFIFV